MDKALLEQLYTITDSSNVSIDEPMDRHTTMRVGGKADCFVIPDSSQEAADIVRLLLANNEPYYVIGNGSNILVGERGIDGCVICISKGLDYINVDSCEITVGAGTMLAKVAAVACDYGLEGMAFASGIPGSVGGAIVMNAGAYGGEMKDIVKSVKVYDVDSGDFMTLSNEEMDFSYRHSIVKSRNYIVLEVVLKLTSGVKEEIREYMNSLAAKRREKQPLEFPSAGSTFKRPEGYFAGKLIEDAGLRGYSIGGAQVSEKHCGFVINKGNASADDVYSLIKYIQKTVMEKSGVMLEPEVIMIGGEL